MIQPERIGDLNERDVRRGRYVLYWMQQSQRAEGNHALEYAVDRANELGLPVVAVFGLTSRFPEANERHYAFMLEGLRETQAELAGRGIQLVVLRRPPVEATLELGRDAALIVADRGNLRVQRQWRRRVAEAAPCRVVRVESDVVVPVHLACQKEQYAARTIRPRIRRHLERFLVPLESRDVARDSMGMRFDGLDLAEIGSLLSRLRINRGALRVSAFRGGTSEAGRLLDAFVARGLSAFAGRRNDPGAGLASDMSPYLHFGQISALEVALRVRGAERDAGRENVEEYLEELIVRRELSMNFCEFNPSYDSFDALPEWARRTLCDHAADPRPHTYGPRELESARTHDPYWNAAQREMLLTGKMHGYMRMYWGKKILEWTPDPAEAMRIALRLNNRCELDGRDPNAFAGVAWCFGKHDQAWAERPVFGKVRYMSAAGLERKFDMDAYVRRVESLA